MWLMKRTAFFVPLLLAGHAFAIDGQILINQSTAMASGGFPYRITNPGSYRLSGDLVAVLNKMAIVISANNVVLDLNGFNVKCSFDSTATTIDFNIGCIGDGGIGFGGVHNITVRNGTVTVSESGAPSTLHPPGLAGLYFVNSQQITAEYLQIEVNTDPLVGRIGYNIGVNSIIRYNILSGGGPGTSCPSLVEGNINTTGGEGRTGLGCVFVNNIGPF
jgi:hypothetical protein